MAPRPGNTLHVYLDGIFAGTAEQKNGSAYFTYDETYLARRGATPLSLSMPLRDRKYTNKVVSAWLEGLLPDSQAVREKWATQYTASANNPFSLLKHVGRDAAGAVQTLPPDVTPSDAATRTGKVDWLSQEQFDSMLRELATHGDKWDPGSFAGRWSLAGAQAKIALHKDSGTRWGIPLDSTPTTHIIKPSINGFDDHHINEALCMLTASRVGLPAARTELIDKGDIQAVISTRYDRDVNPETGRWHRLHQEDMCQALSVHPASKYQDDGGPGVGEIADLLVRVDQGPGAGRADSARRFLLYLAYNVMIGGTDAHAKNYSVLLSGAAATLAPLYDVASSAVYPHHERLVSPMKVGEHKKFLDVTDADWRKVARRLGLDADDALGEVHSLRERIPDAMQAAYGDLPESARPTAQRLGERILEHVRREWKPDLDRDPKTVLPAASGNAAATARG